MSLAARITLLVGILIVALGALAAQFFSVREKAVEIGHYTINTGELTGNVLVGQTFVSERDNLSAIAVMFATYSGRENTKPIQFHLRQAVDASSDIRSGQVDPHSLGDNQFYRFEFEPIVGSLGKTYFFSVTSPESTPGNAVTVDINTQDPYHRGSAYIVKGPGADIHDPLVIARSGKPTIDVAFATYYTVPLRAALKNKMVADARFFISTWNERKGLYFIWAKVALAALLYLLFLLFIQVWYPRSTRALGPQKLTVLLLFLLLVAALGFRYIYSRELPVTDDEGNYLYDARMLHEGRLAGGDGYVKAPLMVAWVALWQLIGGNTIIAGRLSSIVIGALTLYPIYSLSKELWGRKAGLLAAATWTFFGSAIVFDIYVHTQPVALFFATAGLAVVAMALHGTTPRLTFFTVPKIPSHSGWFFLAGILLGLGVASRKSVLAVGLVPLLMILVEGKSWKLKMKHLITVGLGFGLVIAILLAGATLIYGKEGFSEALGFNSAENGVSVVEASQVEQVREYSLRGMTPFFRESLPLILLSVLGLGLALEHSLRRVLQRMARYIPRSSLVWVDHIVPKIGWLLPLGVFWWMWGFFSEYEGAAFMRMGIPTLWYIFGAILLLFTLLPRPRIERITLEEKPIVPQSTQPNVVVSSAVFTGITPHSVKSAWQSLVAALVIPLWVGGLAFFYLNWIKFHANYIAEFIPPLVVVAGYGAHTAYRHLGTRIFWEEDHPWLNFLRRLLIVGLTATLFWALFVSNFITLMYEHTGTFQQKSVNQAAAWAKEHIPMDQPIFTGAAIVPYVSGHHTALDIAHPRWYAYEFTRKDPQRLNTFLPPADKMLEAYRNAQWFLLDKQTGFSFLMEYSEIEAGLSRDWQSVQGIENGSNTLTFYKRVKPALQP